MYSKLPSKSCDYLYKHGSHKYKFMLDGRRPSSRALGEFKTNMVYRNVDFNANKSKQYEAARDAMAIN